MSDLPVTEEHARRGSTMSDRQVREQAKRGRKITCKFFAQVAHEVTGYVVGMDDYHWLIASVIPESHRKENQSPIALMLVHKSRVDATTLHRESTLDSEIGDALSALLKVGKSFWESLERNQSSTAR